MRTAIVWFRRDLRIADHPALSAAVETCERLLPVYVHAPHEAGKWSAGAASNWWLHHSLHALDAELRARGSRLIVLRGHSAEQLAQLRRSTNAEGVFWNRLYEPQLRRRDAAVTEALNTSGATCTTFNGSLLREPNEVENASGEPFRVFTAFWKTCRTDGVTPVPAPEALPPLPHGVRSATIDELGLLPRIRWDTGIATRWKVGESAARRRLQGLPGRYAEERNRPDLDATTHLSPYLHFGEISPRQVVAALRHTRAAGRGPGTERDAEALLRQIGWREFAHYLLYHFPHTTDRPMDARFEEFPWRDDYASDLHAWRRGLTGFPIVDAGMRQLWAIGWMHNRVRMTVASLLTKNLRIPWQEGARWFWDTLVDADLANNTLGWQWTAGSGADAAPYFRIFNPVLQGERHDPKGDYVRTWLPELAGLPARHIHRPWKAPATVLRAAGVTLGERYPAPIVDLRRSREEALEAFARLRSANAARKTGKNRRSR